MDSTTTSLHLSGHDIIILRMAIDSEIEVWKKLIKVDVARRAAGPESKRSVDQCLRDLRGLAAKLDHALEGLGLALEASGICQDDGP